MHHLCRSNPSVSFFSFSFFPNTLISIFQDIDFDAFDKEHADQPFWEAEYAKDIFKYYKEQEVSIFFLLKLILLGFFFFIYI